MTSIDDEVEPLLLETTPIEVHDDEDLYEFEEADEDFDHHDDASTAPCDNSEDFDNESPSDVLTSMLPANSPNSFAQMSVDGA